MGGLLYTRYLKTGRRRTAELREENLTAHVAEILVSLI
jgi:hypothetical protein